MFYLEKYNLKEKVVVINGGARGIGYACAEAFAECGATIVRRYFARSRSFRV